MNSWSKPMVRQYIQYNDGSHLDGGISDDGRWQQWWTMIVILPEWRYSTPKGGVGHIFLKLLVKELQGIKKCKWKS